MTEHNSDEFEKSAEILDSHSANESSEDNQSTGFSPVLKGQIIGGSIAELILRQKSGSNLEIGELLIASTSQGKVLLKVVDLRYGSQISPQNLELASGMNLEENRDITFMEPELRNYQIAILKPLLKIQETGSKQSKTLPHFFSEVYSIRPSDLSFLTKPKNPIFIGTLRSGSELVDVPLFMPGEKVLSHHILIPATTGRGKSNLTSCMLWDCVDKDFSGVLVLDPHDEYYGRNGLGMKDHPVTEKVIYYTPNNPPAGARTLKISLNTLKPSHFRGALSWSDPQSEAIYAFYREFGKDWISHIILGDSIPNLKDFNEATIGVVRRRLQSLLRLKPKQNEILCEGVFSVSSGQSTVADIVSELEKANTVIVDTSLFDGSVEILIGSVISSEIFKRYKRFKVSGVLNEKPVVSIVLEEAPRVLGKEVLEKGMNIFSQIAREGRKFKVGLWAITQLPSLIPRQILANMNTKIILGLEMAPERQAIVESSAQDLSKDERAIAALDIGEAIVSSNFTRFATPVSIPRFKDVVVKTQNEYIKKKHSSKHSSKIQFQGIA